MRNKQGIILDVGGEGRHPLAWNLNPSPVKTVGPQTGFPIPQLILGRADAIPLSAASVSVVIVERTPLQLPALREIWRVAAPGALIVLRHARPPWSDPHQLAAAMFNTPFQRSNHSLGRHVVQETIFIRGPLNDHLAIPSSWTRLCG